MQSEANWRNWSETHAIRVPPFFLRQKHDVQSDLAKGKVFIVTENIVRVVTCLHNIERNYFPAAIT